MKLKWGIPLLIAIAGLGVFAGNVLATLPVGTVSTILGQARFDPIDVSGKAASVPWHARLHTRGLSDVYVVDNKIAVGGSTGWHSHPGPSLILVIAGAVTNYMGDDPTCTPHAYTAGQGFVDPGGNDVHILRNEGTVPAETIAVQLLPENGTRRIDEPDPGNCPF
jgi:quercetin dioxygenase-like cupin family protein